MKNLFLLIFILTTLSGISQIEALFDIKKFHTIVLDQGIVPLFILEDIIDKWIQSA